MADFMTNFEVLKDFKTGEVNGFSLVAQPQTKAKVFCRTFPKALIVGTATIEFEEEKIIFDHPTCSFPGKCTHRISAEESIALQKLLFGNEHQLKFERAGSLTAGFKIVSV